MALPPSQLTSVPASPLTPATDKVFATVELAEWILAQLPLQDLLSTMRTCKSFCTIIKTSKAVMRDKFWLSEYPPSLTEIDDSQDVPEDSQPDTDEFSTGSSSPTMTEKYTSGTCQPLLVPPPFRTYLSFIVPPTATQEIFTLEMSTYGENPGACIIKDRVYIEYRMSKYHNPVDINIRIDPSNAAEIWRRVPLTSASKGARLSIINDDGNTVASKRVSGETTIGDMYIWLSDMVVSLEMTPAEQEGPGVSNFIGPLDENELSSC